MDTVLYGIGTAAAKAIFGLWLKSSPRVREASIRFDDLLARAVRDPREERALKREMERTAEQIADQLSVFFETEFRGLPQEEKWAAGREVIRTLGEVKVSDALLFEANLNPHNLEAELKRRRPQAAEEALLSEAGTAFYEILLREAASYIVEIRLTLPDFNTQATRMMLQRETEIIGLVKLVLERLPAGSSYLDGSADARFETEYRRDVARKQDQLELFGVNASEMSRRYSLSVAYLTLNASRRADGDGEEEHLSFKVDNALKSLDRVLIRGEAGSGKTTLLQWLAVNSARNSFSDTLAEWNDSVPFLIQLRRFVDSPLPTVEEFITGINQHRQAPEGWVHRQLSSGRGLVLIDGVDELPDEKREEGRQWLIDLVSTYPLARYVVTSRPPAVDEEWLTADGFAAVMLEPMDLSAIPSFIDHWHAAALKSVADPDEAAELEALGDRLKEIVRGTRAIRNLASSPLLCAMLCALNRDRRANLPADRIELYRVALEMLLERRDIERKLPSDAVEIGFREKESLLRVFALWLLNNEKSYARAEDLEALIEERLRGMPRVDASAQNVATHLILRSGVLRQPVEGRVDFIHRTFQEYLAAKEAVETRSMGVLVAHSELDQWQEVIVLAAGLASLALREELISALIERGDNEASVKHRVHLLAVGCLDTAAELSPHLTERVNALLANLVPPKTMAEAKAIASAGEIAVPLLGRYATGSTAAAAATCTRALTHIGSESALLQLEKFAVDPRVTVARELLRAWSEFPPEEYAQRILYCSPLEHGAVRVDGPPQLAATRHLRNLRFLTCEGGAYKLAGDLWPWGVFEEYELDGLALRSIPGMTKVPPLGDAERLQTLELNELPALISFAKRKLPALRALSIESCKNLSHLEDVDTLKDLVALKIGNCGRLAELPVMPLGLEWLHCFDLYVDDLTPLAQHPSLRLVGIERCEEVDDLQPLAENTQLECLIIGGPSEVKDLRPLGGLSNLLMMRISGLQHIRDASPLGGSDQLEVLALEDMPLIEDVSWVRDLPELWSLSLAGCHGIERIPAIRQESLEVLNLADCYRLTDLNPLEKLSSLTHLNLRGCTALDDVSPLLNLPNLRMLDLRGCSPSFGLEALRAKEGLELRLGSAADSKSRMPTQQFWSLSPHSRYF
jgi:hypothetical protein